MARLRSATGNTFAQYKAPAFNTGAAKLAKGKSSLPPAGETSSLCGLNAGHAVCGVRIRWLSGCMRASTSEAALQAVKLQGSCKLPSQHP